MKAFIIAFLVLIPSGQAQNKPTRANSQTSHKISTTANTFPIQQVLSSENGNSGTPDKQDHKPTKETRIFGLTPDGFAQALLALILIVVTGFYAVVTFFMLRKVGDQVEIMQQQVNNAGEQLITANRNTVAMFQQVGQMRIANEQTNRLIEQAKASAEAAQTSATAAKLTAERFAQIEGSRIVPTVDWPLRPSITTHSSFEEGNLISRTEISISIKCKNEGKITSWITEKRLGVGVFDHIPQNPDFENIEIIFHGLQEVPKEETFKTDESRICDESYDSGTVSMILIWGIIKYRDVFSDSRYCTFGYWVTVDRKLKRINLPIYNQST